MWAQQSLEFPLKGVINQLVCKQRLKQVESGVQCLNDPSGLSHRRCWHTGLEGVACLGRSPCCHQGCTLPAWPASSCNSWAPRRGWPPPGAGSCPFPLWGSWWSHASLAWNLGKIWAFRQRIRETHRHTVQTLRPPESSLMFSFERFFHFYFIFISWQTCPAQHWEPNSWN